MPQTYTFASWNVNGLRAVLKKDPSFIQIAQELDVDILALQETKLQEGQVDIDLPGYHQTWSYAERKGYSGTAVFSRQEPLRVLRADALLPYAGEGEAAELVAQAATEGRVCALEFDKFWFVDVYTPNAQNELSRIDVRMAWDDAYRGFLSALERETGKPVVTCGDFNVAHEEIDLKKPQVQPRQRRLFGRGARQVYRAARRRLHRYLARGKPLRRGRLQLVELPL